jgi:FtsP/CotA-like multicopper oxidase with cupredoxin domain
VLLLASSAGRAAEGAPRTRVYYLAADELEWDYAPGGKDAMMGEPFSADAKVFVERGRERIGRVYRKARFRAYTDESFSRLQPREARWDHLGILGPLLRAEVGDEIRVVFRNNTGFPLSVHPHGLSYDKGSEGTPYDDGTEGVWKADDAVPPRGTHSYRWRVPERSGPGAGDPSSVVWLYHAHTNEPRDTMTGLIGALIVTAKGAARADGSPRDVDREFITLYAIFDENESWLLDDNIRRYTGRPEAVRRDDEGFIESNLMHTINGFVYGNLPMMEMQRGERVRWYVLGFGNEVDLHTPHWHGATVLENGHRRDVVSLLPAATTVADMIPDNAGIWMLHCHVHDHLKAGMTARFRVLP